MQQVLRMIVWHTRGNSQRTTTLRYMDDIWEVCVVCDWSGGEGKTGSEEEAKSNSTGYPLRILAANVCVCRYDCVVCVCACACVRACVWLCVHACVHACV